jgi:hypothetical protein
MSPSPVKSKTLLVGKIEVICERIVRGRHAVNAWQVKVHRILRITAIVLSALSSVGLVAVNANPDLPKQTGWPLIGSLVSLIFSILLQVANELGIEQTATQARSAKEAFSGIEANLDIVLVAENPIELVNKLLEETNGLWTKYTAVIWSSSPATDAESKALAAQLVGKYSGHWNLPSERRKRRPKPPDTSGVQPVPPPQPPAPDQNQGGTP